MTDLKRLQDDIDRHGTDTSVWPGRERAWAEALLGRSGEARAALARAKAFDRALLNAAPDARTDVIRRAVLDALPAHRLAGHPARTVRAPLWGWLSGCAAVAATLVLSFYVGTANPGVWPSAGEEPDDAVYADFDGMLFGIGFAGDRT